MAEVAPLLPSNRRKPVNPAKEAARSWYRDVGGGMGQALNARTEFAEDSSLEGTGFELLVRGRDETGCCAF
jgi:hypothetical protein